MKDIFTYLKPFRRLISLVFLLIFVRSLAELYLPTLMGNIVDNGVVTGNITYIWKTGSLMLLIAAVTVLVSVLASFYSAKIAMGFGRNIRAALFKHINKFSLSNIEQVGTASLITRTTNDVTQLQQATIMMLRMVMTAPFMLIGGIIMAVSKDAKLSLTILIALPFIVVTILIILRKGMPLFRAVQKRIDELNLVLRENLTGIRVIRAFTKEVDERKRLNQANTNLTNVSIKVNRLMAFTMPLMMLFMNVTIVLIIWFGSIRIDGGNMQIGDLMAFIQYVMLIMFALMMASMMFIIVPRATVSINRIMDVLNMKETEQVEGEQQANKAKGFVQFENVTFYYAGADEPALKNVNFTARPGETTAIIGGTGSGKTTLINLIPRFFEATEGTIKINGVNVEDTTVKEVREKVGLVPQHALLFSGTVNDNVRVGNEQATDTDVKHAIKIAQAADFVEKMEKTYDTYIEQGGANLSGGQKQRLSIARALVKKPDIYLFDDSFSALDYKTDANLRHALQEETRHASVIIVAQRVSTVLNADQIIVLDQGEVVGIGTHDELLKTSDVYKEIVTSQLGEGESA